MAAGGSRTHIRIVAVFSPSAQPQGGLSLPPELGPSLSGHVAAGQRNHFTGRRSDHETTADYQRFVTVIRVRQMIEAVAAILGLFSASVFLAHAVDAYRAPLAARREARRSGFRCQRTARLHWPADEASQIGYKYQMHLTSAPYLFPITSLLAGLFLLLAPRVVSFAVAVYLIFVGLLGLNGMGRIFK